MVDEITSMVVLSIVRLTKLTPGVKLKFSPKEGPYIKSQPLHNTQEILIDNQSEFIITLDVVPSYELKAQILSYGENVEVIEPQTLRNEISQTLKNAKMKYEKR